MAVRPVNPERHVRDDTISVRRTLELFAAEVCEEGGPTFTFVVDERSESLPNLAKSLVILVVREWFRQAAVPAGASACRVSVSVNSFDVTVEAVHDGDASRGLDEIDQLLILQPVEMLGGVLSTEPDAQGAARLTVTFESYGSTFTPESSIDPFVVLCPLRDDDGRVIDFVYAQANAAALTYVGRTREELVGARLTEVWPSDRDAGLLDAYIHTIETGEPLIHDDFVFFDEHGSGARHIDIRAVRSGESLRYTWRDVTERFRLTEEYRILAENASDVVFRLDADRNLKWVSPSVERELGWKPEDLVGEFLGGITHPDDVLHVAVWEGSTQGGGSAFEARLRDREGVYHWFSVTDRLVDVGDAPAERVGCFRNVDEEHRQREELSSSEERYRLLAENASDAIFLLDADAVVQWASPSTFEMTGWSAGAIVGGSLDVVVAPEDLDAVTRALQQTGSAPAQLEYRVRWPDGSRRWVQARGRSFAGSAGGLQGRVVIMRDIQAEVEARDALSESRSDFRLLAENASDVVYRCDRDGVVEWISPSVRRVLGWDPDALVGAPILDLIDDADRPAAQEDQAEVLAGRAGRRLEIRFRSAQGELHWMSKFAQPLRGRSGEISGVVVGLRLIDLEVATRRDLEQSENSLRTLAQNASDIVTRVDSQGIIDWISPSVETELGWMAADLVGKPAIDLISKDDVTKVLAWRTLVFSGESLRNLDVRYLRADGRISWMSVNVHPIFDGDQRVVGEVIGAREVNSEVAARRASDTLAAASQALLRSEDESELLQEMCDVAVLKGGYSLSWYGRKIHDEERSVAKVACSERNRDYVDSIEVSWGSAPSGRGPTGEVLRHGKTFVLRDLQNAPSFAPWRTTARAHELCRRPSPFPCTSAASWTAPGWSTPRSPTPSTPVPWPRWRASPLKSASAWRSCANGSGWPGPSMTSIS